MFRLLYENERIKMRKFRATDVSDVVEIKSNGQDMKYNMFCVNCHGVGTYETHYPECNEHESYSIPATAEVPRRCSSKHKWNIFKKQFVFIRPKGFWLGLSKSWWEKTKK